MAGVLLSAGVGLTGGRVHAQRMLPQQAGLPAVSLSGPCLRSGRAYLRASIRGAVRLDVDLHGSQVSCEGGPRLDGSGIRIGFEGRAGSGGRRVRMVFGIDGAREGRPGQELPTNLTVIFEGERQLFATQGDRNCTIDRLRQERISGDPAPTHALPAGAETRSYLVTAHGFCIAPANDLGGKRRILVTTFDFAGRADFEPPPRQQ
ncbi:MAG TPA: hypothetical protein VFA39_02175 [Steroidobacteraceae bacterium]|nr:hypothetical protein [Steroidobacteraceae bacterium]